MARPHLFFISGLGADHRAFARLRLDGYQQTHLPWIEPSWKDDLHSYARKLAGPVVEAENPVVVGLSLGGMLASEMTTFIPHMRAILVSSIKSPRERSPILKLGNVFPVQRLMPPHLMQNMTFLWSAMKRKDLKPEDARHMITMFREQNDKFLRWAIVQAPRWRGEGDAARIVHIHGTADRMFPIHRIENAIPVKGGTHLMIHTKAEEVEKIMLRELNPMETVLSDHNRNGKDHGAAIHGRPGQ